jgi:hypothetical protein
MKATILCSLQFAWVVVASYGRSLNPAFVSSMAPLPSRAKKSFRSSNLDADSKTPELHKSDNSIHAYDDTINMLRGELKGRLLKAADDYASLRGKTDELVLRAKEFDEHTNTAATAKEQRFVPRLLGKIISKISRRKHEKVDENSISQSQGILTSDSFRQMKLDVGEKGNKVIELAQQLSLLNPTPNPTFGFKGYGGVSAKENKLNGEWTLRFPTEADASFAESKERGVATTSQLIDAEKGTFTNVVDFEKGNLRGFRVVVSGTPLSNTDIGLSFKKVNLLRNSRLLGKVTIRLPSRLIRWLATRNKPQDERNAPYLSLKYLDEDLRIHTTDSDNWFVQSRIS